MIRLFCFALLISLSLLSCEMYEQDRYEDHYVVEGVLRAGEPLPQIRITTTVPIGEPYDYSSLSTVLDADVQVQLLSDSDGDEIEQVYSYANINKRYLPDEEHIVETGRRYSLKITIPEYEREITAVTTVPENIRIASQNRDTLKYQSEELLKLELEKSARGNRDIKFLINAEAGDFKRENLTPVFKKIVAEKDIHFYNRLVLHLWNMFTENSFKTNEQGQIAITYPWNEFAFFGRNNIIISSIDDNLYDYLRSEMIQQENGKTSPGEIYNVISTVNGALGVFGSMTADTARVYLKQ